MLTLRVRVVVSVLSVTLGLAVQHPRIVIAQQSRSAGPLPPIFAVGKLVKSGNATFRIHEVHGVWILVEPVEGGRQSIERGWVNTDAWGQGWTEVEQGGARGEDGLRGGAPEQPSASSDRAKLASIKMDLRGLMVAMEAYFSDHAAYPVDFNALRESGARSPGQGVVAVSRMGDGYSVTVRNASILSGPKECTVKVGGGTPRSMDGVIVCR